MTFTRLVATGQLPDHWKTSPAKPQGRAVLGGLLVLKRALGSFLVLELLVLGGRHGNPRKKPPSTLQELQATLEGFVGGQFAVDVRLARCATCVSGPKSVSGDKATQSKIRQGYLSANHVYIISNDLQFHVSIDDACAMIITRDIAVSKVTFIMKTL